MTMKSIILYPLVLVSMVTVAVGQQRPQFSGLVPCTEQHDEDQVTGPPLPTLPSQFWTIVEANIVQKNYTVAIEEFYDYNNNRGAVITTRNGTSHRSILNFNTLERITINKDTCHVHNMTSSRFNIFNFTTNATGGHIVSVKDILEFGKEFGEVFIGGNERVRGISVNHWQSCLQIISLNGSFNLDYYFSSEDYLTASGHIQIPVRAVVNGTAHTIDRNGTVTNSMHSFYHIYDFVRFEPGPILDESVFQIPVGVFCNGSNITQPFPYIPDYFSVGIETLVLDSLHGNDLLNLQVYVDYQSQLVRMDHFGLGTSTKMFERFRGRAVSLIYDFNTGLEYHIDMAEKNCNVTQVINSDIQQDFFVDHGYRSLKHASDLLNIGVGNYTYQGQKLLRNQIVHSWSTGPSVVGELQEIFFVKALNIIEMNQGLIPFGMYRKVAVPDQGAQVDNKIYVSQYTNFYSFVSGHPDPEVFDVLACYSKFHSYINMKVLTSGIYQLDVWGHEKEFYASARAILSKAAKVSATRISSLKVEDAWEKNGYLQIHFSLLDNLPAKSLDGTTLTDMGISLDKAQNNMWEAIKRSLRFNVIYTSNNSKSFLIQEDSLQQSNPDSTVSSGSKPPTYSQGAMAGMAIGMLVIGAILGLVCAYIIYKRIDTSVPYQTQMN